MSGEWQWVSERSDELQRVERELGVPAVRCPRCAGTGLAGPTGPTGYHPPEACRNCSGKGMVRAQLVVSLVDLPTGRVGSRSIVPGVLTARVSAKGEIVLDLAEAVADLAADLGVGAVRQGAMPGAEGWDLEGSHLIKLGYSVDDDVSERWQFEHEGAAIAKESYWRPHKFFYAGLAAKPVVDADEALRRLAAVGDQLQLDLVIEVKAGLNDTLRWRVALQLPGSRPAGYFGAAPGTLHRALIDTDVGTALKGLTMATEHVPARWLAEGPALMPDWGRPDELTWGEISARLTPAVVRDGLARAVYRLGEWYFPGRARTVEIDDDGTTATAGADGLPEGSGLAGHGGLPEPAGELIPTGPCGSCHGVASEKCLRCRGAGVEPLGLVLTIADLQSRATHVNWYPLPEVDFEGTGQIEDGAELPQVVGTAPAEPDEPAFGTPEGEVEALQVIMRSLLSTIA